jgi:hypothetical protein
MRSLTADQPQFRDNTSQSYTHHRTAPCITNYVYIAWPNAAALLDECGQRSSLWLGDKGQLRGPCLAVVKDASCLGRFFHSLSRVALPDCRHCDVDSEGFDHSLSARSLHRRHYMLPEQTQVVRDQIHGRFARLLQHFPGPDHKVGLSKLGAEILDAQQEKLEPAERFDIGGNLVAPDWLVVAVPELRRNLAFLAAIAGPGGNEVDLVVLKVDPRRPGRSGVPITRRELVLLLGNAARRSHIPSLPTLFRSLYQLPSCPRPHHHHHLP